MVNLKGLVQYFTLKALF